MSPSFAGHPSILAEICRYSADNELARILRVSHELHDIAGRKLYRNILVRPGTRSVFSDYVSLISASLAGTATTQLVMEPYRLIRYIESIEIPETGMRNLGLSLRRSPQLAAPRPSKPLRRLIIRADSYSGMATRGFVFGEGWDPEELVVVGGNEALNRVTRYNHLGSAVPEQPGGWQSPPGGHGRECTQWPSVKVLRHIIPCHDKVTEEDQSIFTEEDIDITRSFPNLTEYNIFFSIQDADWDDIGSFTGFYFARALAWIIRNTPEDLSLRIWLSPRTREAFEEHKEFIEQAVLHPFGPIAHERMDWEDDRYPIWDEKRFLARVSSVAMKLCGAGMQRSLEAVASGEPFIAWDHVPKKPATSPSAEEDREEDWSDVDEEEEDEDEEQEQEQEERPVREREGEFKWEGRPYDPLSHSHDEDTEYPMEEEDSEEEEGCQCSDCEDRYFWGGHGPGYLSDGLYGGMGDSEDEEDEGYDDEGW